MMLVYTIMSFCDIGYDTRIFKEHGVLANDVQTSITCTCVYVYTTSDSMYVTGPAKLGHKLHSITQQANLYLAN